MATPDRRNTPFLSLRTPRTGEYLGRRVRMQVNTDGTEDDNISKISSPRGVETPRPGYTAPDENEDDRDQMEEQLHNFFLRLVYQPEEILEMLSHAQYTTWDTFMMMDVDEIPELTFPCWRGPVRISTRSKSTLIQIKELMNAEYQNDAERGYDPEYYTLDMYRKFVFAPNAAKRQTSLQYLSTNKSPGTKFGVVQQTQIPNEKAYETWKKGR